MKGLSWKSIGILIVGIPLGWMVSRTAGLEGPFRLGVDEEILGVVENSKITRTEVEAIHPAELLEHRKQHHTLTEQALEEAIRTKLIGLEAGSRGLDPAEVLRQEVDDQVPEPSDAEILAFFQDRQLDGPLEQLAPSIRALLLEESRSERFSTFLEALRETYPVEKVLEPFRVPVTSEGYPATGSPGAPVTIIEFSDFQCPYCRQLLTTLDQVDQAYGEHVRLVFRHFPLRSIHPDAQKAAEASMCADDQGAFWQMHDAMFANQQALGAPALKRTADSLGLNMDAFNACLDSGEYADRVAADLAAGRRAGVSGTPALFANGRFLSGLQGFEAVAGIIDDELRRAGLPVERRPVEPTRVAVDVEGFPSKGPGDALVTILEFSDFQCPYCRIFSGTLGQVEEAYGDQVRFVFRQFPLVQIHPQALGAAKASLCAHEQGMFWEMHDSMFADQSALQIDQLKATARELGLDGTAFNECLDTDRYAQEVVVDLQAGGAAGVRGTPMIFINGRALSGVKPFEDLVEIIEDELRRGGR